MDYLEHTKIDVYNLIDAVLYEQICADARYSKLSDVMKITEERAVLDFSKEFNSTTIAEVEFKSR